MIRQEKESVLVVEHDPQRLVVSVIRMVLARTPSDRQCRSTARLSCSRARLEKGSKLSSDPGRLTRHQQRRFSSHLSSLDDPAQAIKMDDAVFNAQIGNECSAVGLDRIRDAGDARGNPVLIAGNELVDLLVAHMRRDGNLQRLAAWYDAQCQPRCTRAFDNADRQDGTISHHFTGLSSGGWSCRKEAHRFLANWIWRKAQYSRFAEPEDAKRDP